MAAPRLLRLSRKHNFNSRCNLNHLSYSYSSTVVEQCVTTQRIGVSCNSYKRTCSGLQKSDRYKSPLLLYTFTDFSGHQFVPYHAFSTNKRCSNRKCWKCEESLNPTSDTFFCPCGVIMEPDQTLNYFDLFNLEKGFDVDQKTLAQFYKEIQRRLHPDKFSQKSAIEKQYSADQSSLVNKAYSTLIKPLSRGLYLLELEGLQIDEKTDNSDVEPEFLMDIMEINESLQEASSLDEVRKIGDENQAAVKELVQELSLAFGKGELSTAKKILIHLKYYTNIEEKVKEIERNQFGTS